MNISLLDKRVGGLLLLMALTGCGGGAGSTTTVTYPVWVSDPIKPLILS
jgi:hypothetical protein